MKLRDLWRKKRRGVLRGKLDGPRNDRNIAGWLAEMGNPQPRTFVLTVDGTEVVRARADRHRADLQQAGINAGNHSFSVPPPAHLIDKEPHDLELIDAETGQVIFRTTKRFGRALRKNRRGIIRGKLNDATNDPNIAGWLAEMGNPQPRAFVLTADGMEIARAQADRYRADLERAGIHAGNHSSPFLCQHL